MAIFGPKPWVNPFAIISIYRLLYLLVFVAQKGVFAFQNIVKDIFLAYIAQKEKVGKMAIFGPKPWVNPFTKISIFSIKIWKNFQLLTKPQTNPFGTISVFRVFEFLVFIIQKGVSSFKNMAKTFFWPIFSKIDVRKNYQFFTKPLD